MGTPRFKHKVQLRLKELEKKQEIVGDRIGISNKGNFSTRLSEASKFSTSEITKLSSELSFDNEESLIIDTELFCDEKFSEFLSIVNTKECEIQRLQKIIEKEKNEPMGTTTMAFFSFFGGIITTLLIQFTS